MSGINSSANCNCVYKSDAEGMEMQSAFRQLHLLCMKSLVISFPASPLTSWGLVLFSAHNSAAGLVTKKTHHKPLKTDRRKAFLSGMRIRSCLGGCMLPAFCVAHPCSCEECLSQTGCPEMEDTLFTEQGCCERQS